MRGEKRIKGEKRNGAFGGKTTKANVADGQFPIDGEFLFSKVASVLPRNQKRNACWL